MSLGSSVRAVLSKTAFLGLIALCGTAAQASDHLNDVNPGAGFSSVSRSYPSTNARYARIGTPRELAQVRRIAIGQSENDIQGLLGRPAIRNGDGSYEFHLSLPLTRRDRLICQYRVYFDGARKVSHAAWRRPQCANLVASKRD